MPPRRDLVAAYNGVYIGEIVATPAGETGQWVVVPRLNGATAMRVTASYTEFTYDPDHRQRVFVATLSGLKDVLGIIAPVHSG